MLQPVRTKWRKAHKGRIHGTATRASSINYGSFALKALQPERITGKQIEAARVALNKTYEETRKSLDKNISKYTSIKKTY